LPVRIHSPKKKKYSILNKLFGSWVILPVLLVLLLLCALGWKAGNWFVYGDSFEHVDWAVTLAGQSRDCERSDHAVELFIQQKIDTLLISSIRTFKTRYTGEFLVPDLLQQGVPRDNIFEIRHDSYSTIEEASLIIKQLRLLNLDTVLIITSNFHSARTRFIFNLLAKGTPHFLVSPAPYEGYDPEAWWTSRKGRKTLFLEFTKYIASRFEVALKNYSSPIEGAAQTVNIVPDIGFSGRIPEEIAPEEIEAMDNTGFSSSNVDATNSDSTASDSEQIDTKAQGDSTGKD
jgi:uncharacterized SAM-binding protein YcdF (DUF218 family)